MRLLTGAQEGAPIEEALEALRIAPPDVAAAGRARRRWDAIAKPLGALGTLEDVVCQVAALTGNEQVDIARRCVVVLCADNGVVDEGVSQSGPEVTFAVARALAEGHSSVNLMCASQGIDCLAVDMGMCEHLPVVGLLDRHIAAGTGNIAQGSAMTRAQAVQAVSVGIELVHTLADQGYGLICTGEMGIGNTTTATAMTCAFLGCAPEDAVGRGAGLSDEGLSRKVRAITRALDVNAPDANDTLGVLAKLGGFDIAGLCGVFIGGALYRVPVVIDGFISMVAAYTARQLCPACSIAMLASHRSAESAADLLAERMGLKPIIDAGMHLGEGTGAVCLVPLLDMALALYHEGDSFAARGITAYKPLGGERS